MTFTTEYTYRASDMDSKLSCRSIALQEAKRALLEKLGTYLIAETQVKDYKMTKDHVTMLSAGIVAAEVLQEQWDGAVYSLKAKITVDPDVVARQVKAVGKDRERVRELEESRQKVDAALKEVARLRAELEASRAGAGGRTGDARQNELRYTESELKYARAVQDLRSDDIFAGFLFTMKDGSTFIWKKYEEMDGQYCQVLSAGRICIQARDVASIRKGEYPAGAEVISTPPVDEADRKAAVRDWKSTQSANEKAIRTAECQRMFDALQGIGDRERYYEEYRRYQKTCAGVTVDRTAEEERSARKPDRSPQRYRGKDQSDMDRIMQDARDGTVF